MVLKLYSMDTRWYKTILLEFVVKLVSTDIFWPAPPLLSNYFTIYPTTLSGRYFCNDITYVILEGRVTRGRFEVNLGQLGPTFHGYNDFELCTNTCDEILPETGCW